MRSFRDLPLKSKIYFVVMISVGSIITISYLAFIEVTLRRALAAASPWEAVAAFLVVTAGLVVAARAMGLHESR